MKNIFDRTRLFEYIFLTHLVSLVVSIVLAQFLCGILLIVAVWNYIVEGNYRWTIFDTLVVVFLGVRIIAIFCSEYADESRITWLREIIFYPYYFIASYYFQKTGFAGLKKSIGVLVYSSAVAAVVAVMKVVFGIAARGSSLTSGYATLASHLTIVFGLSIPVILWNTDMKEVGRYLWSLALIIMGTLSTFTRGAWVAIGVMGCMAIIISKRRVLLIAAAATVVVIFLLPPVRMRLVSLFNPAENDSGRIQLWSLAREAYTVHPYLGYGPESFKKIIPDRSILADAGVTSWHNDLVQVAMESGILGLLSYLIFPVIILYYLYRARERIQSSVVDRRNLLTVGFVGIAIAFDSLLQGIVFSILNGFLVKYYIAWVGVSLPRQTESKG